VRVSVLWLEAIDKEFGYSSCQCDASVRRLTCVLQDGDSAVYGYGQQGAGAAAQLCVQGDLDGMIDCSSALIFSGDWFLENQAQRNNHHEFFRAGNH
jgi:hypothetical protein